MTQGILSSQEISLCNLSLEQIKQLSQQRPDDLVMAVHKLAVEVFGEKTTNEIWEKCEDLDSRVKNVVAKHCCSGITKEIFSELLKGDSTLKAEDFQFLELDHNKLFSVFSPENVQKYVDSLGKNQKLILAAMESSATYSNIDIFSRVLNHIRNNNLQVLLDVALNIATKHGHDDLVLKVLSCARESNYIISVLGPYSLSAVFSFAVENENKKIITMLLQYILQTFFKLSLIDENELLKFYEKAAKEGQGDIFDIIYKYIVENNIHFPIEGENGLLNILCSSAEEGRFNTFSMCLTYASSFESIPAEVLENALNNAKNKAQEKGYRDIVDLIERFQEEFFLEFQEEQSDSDVSENG